MLKPDTLALSALLASMTALGPLATDMYLPSLPNIAGAMTTGAAQVQWTLSAFLVGFAVGQIFHGPLADRHGRKPVLLGGLGLFVVATIACGLANSIEALVVGRFFQALGASGPIVLARAVVRDLYQGARAGQEMARMGMLMGLVPAIAPFFGGLLEVQFGWRASFFFCAAYGLIGAGVVLQGLPETVPVRLTSPFSLRAIAGGFASILKVPSYQAHIAIVCTAFGGLFAFISGSSFVLQSLYGMSEVGYGIGFGLCALAFVGGSMLARRLVPRVGVQRSIALGTLAMAGGGLAMLAATALLDSGSPVEVIAPMMLYMVGIGLALAQAQTAALMPFPDRAGTASSLTGVMQMSVAAAIGLVVGAHYGASGVPLALIIAALGVGALLIERASRAIRGAG
ncbi:MAG: multidrug effflux MFS transporter [Hyphomicrobiaceae bacterium]|nr:multidrug effflux MFS transporter [Hyphomicrobiaceae bacterium]